ncbi:hypothetical protein Sgleb_41610 [Streptomyces glebosus]|uniref:Uncharacterized protein n=1 Tax=Streptomyces glebosus TaxID=249580 RepID=A0A640SYX7_9ACTN|nr:hypothetical protein Sgleb_41610 [Streptomyces glebosus]GHG60108.1 hypothetical protein GCM10010513_25300 [Streptomyces glebosus]
MRCQNPASVLVALRTESFRGLTARQVLQWESARTAAQGHPRHKVRAYLPHGLRSKQMHTRRTRRTPRGVAVTVVGSTAVRKKAPRPAPALPRRPREPPPDRGRLYRTAPRG